MLSPFAWRIILTSIQALSMFRWVVIIALLAGLSTDSSAAFYSVYRGKAYRVGADGRLERCRLSRCPMCDRLQANFFGATSPREALAGRPRAVVHVEQSLPASMPSAAVEAMLGVVSPASDDVLYDLGSGDGRILEHANTRYGCQFVGIEIDEATWKRSVERLNREGVTEGWVLHGDATTIDLSGADLVTVYLYPEVMERIRFDTLKIGAKVISYGHPIPNLPTKQIDIVTNGVTHVFYLYESGF